MTIHGFQANVNGGYDSPDDAFARTLTPGPADVSEVGEAIFDVDSYLPYGQGKCDGCRHMGVWADIC